MKDFISGNVVKDCHSWECGERLSFVGLRRKIVINGSEVEDCH